MTEMASANAPVMLQRSAERASARAWERDGWRPKCGQGMHLA